MKVIEKLFGLVLVILEIIFKILVGATYYWVFLGYKEWIKYINNPLSPYQQSSVLELIVSWSLILLFLYWVGKWTVAFLRSIFTGKAKEIDDEDKESELFPHSR